MSSNAPGPALGCSVEEGRQIERPSPLLTSPLAQSRAAPQLAGWGARTPRRVPAQVRVAVRERVGVSLKLFSL